MNTHDIEPLKYGGDKNDDYVTGWNDCWAAIEADRKTYNSIGEGTIQQLHDVLLYLQNETMKLEAAYGSNFKKEATEKARAATEKMKEAVYAIKNIDRKRRDGTTFFSKPYDLPPDYPSDEWVQAFFGDPDELGFYSFQGDFGNVAYRYQQAFNAGTQGVACKRRGEPVVPPVWLSDQIGGVFDDITPGQGYRMGWNDCRDAMLERAPQPAEPVKEQP